MSYLDYDAIAPAPITTLANAVTLLRRIHRLEAMIGADPRATYDAQAQLRYDQRAWMAIDLNTRIVAHVTVRLQGSEARP